MTSDVDSRRFDACIRTRHVSAVKRSINNQSLHIQIPWMRSHLAFSPALKFQDGSDLDVRLGSDRFHLLEQIMEIPS